MKNTLHRADVTSMKRTDMQHIETNMNRTK